MSQVSLCPRCRQPVSLPPGLDPELRVRCPVCQEEYPLKAALAEQPTALPPLIPVPLPATLPGGPDIVPAGGFAPPAAAEPSLYQPQPGMPPYQPGGAMPDYPPLGCAASDSAPEATAYSLAPGAMANPLAALPGVGPLETPAALVPSTSDVATAPGVSPSPVDTYGEVVQTPVTFGQPVTSSAPADATPTAESPAAETPAGADTGLGFHIPDDPVIEDEETGEAADQETVDVGALMGHAPVAPAAAEGAAGEGASATAAPSDRAAVAGYVPMQRITARLEKQEDPRKMIRRVVGMIAAGLLGIAVAFWLMSLLLSAINKRSRATPGPKPSAAAPKTPAAAPKAKAPVDPNESALGRKVRLEKEKEAAKEQEVGKQSGG